MHSTDKVSERFGRGRKRTLWKLECEGKHENHRTHGVLLLITMFRGGGAT